MTVTPEMKQEILDDPDCMELLSNMVDYRKNLLLELIQSGTILEYLLKTVNHYLEMKSNPTVQKQLENLPPGGEQEVNYMLLTGNDPEMKLCEWTAPEARTVNAWWAKTFPDEKNPVGLDEDELQERQDASKEENELLNDLEDLYQTIP